MNKPNILVEEKFRSKSEKELRDNVQQKMKNYVISQIKNSKK